MHAKPRLALLAVSFAIAFPAAAQTPPAIDLKMFPTAEVNLSRGCSVALWQANRDPARDKFAYLFIEMLQGPNHARQPARIRIGEQTIQLQRIAKSGRTPGYDLYEVQRYRMPTEGDTVTLELKLADEEGEAVAIEGGTMTVAMRGRAPFRVQVKGGAGCMTPPAR